MYGARGYLPLALLAAVLVVRSLALPAPTAAGGKAARPPVSPGLPVLSSVSFSPAIVAGGSPATGTVKFGSVTDGAVVTLFNSHPAIVSVPAEMVVSGGQSSGAFPVTTTSVTIPRATWSAGILKIDATSTNPNAILTVHLTVNDSFMFALTNLGGGRYQTQRPWVDNPLSITVHSNFGGAATKSTVR